MFLPRIAATFLALSTLACATTSTPPPDATGGDADAAAIDLFDGTTLDGWRQLNGTATYVVEDGTILGTTNEGSPNSFLCTERTFGDFELTFEVMLYADELNSGVQIRSKTKPPEGDEAQGRVFGPQVEIEASGEAGAEAGYIYGEAIGGGWRTPEAELIPHSTFADGAWNSYRVLAQGARILGDGEPRIGAHGKPVLFLHPKDFTGTLVELEQV